MEGKKVDNERVNLKSAAIASASCVVFEDPWTRSFFTATTADSHCALCTTPNVPSATCCNACREGQKIGKKFIVVEG